MPAPKKKVEKVRLAPFMVTREQMEWLDKKAETTGESKASIVRAMIQQRLIDTI